RFSAISSDTDFTRLEKLLILVLYPIVKGKKITDKSVLVLSTTKGNITLLENQKSEVSEANLGKLAQKTARFFGFTTEPVEIGRFSAISSDTDFTRLEKLLILVLYPIVKGKKITDKSVLVLSTTKGNITLLENQKSEVSEANLGKLAQKTARFFGFTTEPV